MADLGYSDGYRYAHDYPGHFADLEFMPSELIGRRFYEPADNKQEDGLRTRLESLWPKYYPKKM
jgi:putative ATPase